MTTGTGGGERETTKIQTTNKECKEKLGFDREWWKDMIRDVVEGKHRLL